MILKTSRRTLSLKRPLVMGILNITPDSFSDGGKFSSVDAALNRVEEMVGEGADIIDIGGESTRPGSERVSAETEISRVVPLIDSVCKRFDIPVSIDTTKSEVADAAVNAGAKIINDISGLRWDPRIAEVAAKHGTGLVIMHSRGSFETMHSQPPVDDIMKDVTADFRRSITAAEAAGVAGEQIALDIGIGFGKTQEQNVEVIARLNEITRDFVSFPVLIGASRKSFIGKILNRADPADRLAGSLAAAAVAYQNGAAILRVHDVRETVDVLKMCQRLR